MSHVVGSLQTLVSPVVIGPASGAPSNPANTWKVDFAPSPAPLGTRFVILHFENVSLQASNRLEVDLGYDMDVFTATSGSDFWTRPVNISAFGGKVPIRYITNGSALGGATLDRYGRGERSAGEQDPTALSNCDPFLVDLAPGYREPKYDPFWFCHTPPNWQNVACLPVGDIRRTVGVSVGMVVDVGPNEHNTATIVSTCSVTLIGPDEVLYAGHCVSTADQIRSTGSVAFGYQTDCRGNKPGGYNCRFFKVAEVKRLRWEGPGNADYCILRLHVPPGGLGIPAIPMRFDLPAANENVFGIHHPNGAVKKMSPTTGFATVISSSANAIRVSLDVSGGSSGSGLYDQSGRIVGVLSNGGACSLAYYPTATIAKDIAAAPPPSPPRDVMIVLDRSGSMTENTSSGGTKIQGARDAATLFTQLIRVTGGHKLGMVSFSTSASAPVDFALSPANAANKAALISKVNLVSPGGATSIGDGLQSAGGQLPSASPNLRSVLLLTDGLQNSSPLIANVSVQAAIAGVEVDVIGLGTETNIDGPLMSSLATSHSGRYARANTALDLKKYFALAFGDIFENGSLLDPELFLPAAVPAAAPLPFNVCGEESLTVVVGWDRPDSLLAISLRTPAGAILSGGPGVEVVAGNTWMFLRVPLPVAGERDGAWQVLVAHATGGGEFPPAPVDTRYFVNIVVSGGPRLRRIGDTRRLRYTGDRFTPVVALYYPGGGYPPAATVQLEVTGPDTGIGNVLSDARLGPTSVINGDTLAARQATLQAIEARTGQPVVRYVTRTFDLHDEREFGTGTFEASGVFANPLADLFLQEGNYTFHARATYGDGCTATRELFWTMHVEVGVDPSRSTVTVTVLGSNPDGTKNVRIDITFVDTYGNKVGPGRGENLPIAGAPGTVIVGPVQDNGDGSYTIAGVWNPSAGAAPGLVITQPDRPPAEISDPSVPTEEGHGSLVVTFADAAGHTVPDLADIFVKHFQLSDQREARRWHTEKTLVFRNLVSTNTGIYSLQALPDHHHAVGQFVAIREGQVTRVTLGLRDK